MTIAFDASAPVFKHGAGLGQTTASFTAPAGSLLLALPCDTDTASLLAYTTTDSGLLTWVQEAANATEGCACFAPSVLLPTAAARTITVTRTSGGGGEMALLTKVVTGTAGIGAVNNGGTSTSANFNAAAITTTAANSLVAGLFIDDNGASTLTSSDTGTVLGAAPHNDKIFVVKSAITPVAGTAVTLNVQASGSPAWRWIAFEILDAGGAPAGPIGTKHIFQKVARMRAATR